MYFIWLCYDSIMILLRFISQFSHDSFMVPFMVLLWFPYSSLTIHLQFPYSSLTIPFTVHLRFLYGSLMVLSQFPSQFTYDSFTVHFTVLSWFPSWFTYDSGHHRTTLASNPPFTSTTVQNVSVACFIFSVISFWSFFFVLWPYNNIRDCTESNTWHIQAGKTDFFSFYQIWALKKKFYKNIF